MRNIRLSGINVSLSILFVHAGAASFSNKPDHLHHQPQQDHKHAYGLVRVLLKTIPAADKDPVTISTTGNSLHTYIYVQDGKKLLNKAERMSICHKGGIFFVNGKKVKQPLLHITPLTGHISLDGKSYDGHLVCMFHNKELLIINEVPLEEYICSVLHTESWPGWPLEVNKVFAIASRTYVISMMMQAQKTGRPFHVHNCKKHQTYQGVHDKKILKDAVKQTEGVILTHDGKPIIAMFDSCCGGIIPAHMEDVVFADAPYLARPYACTYCKPCWIYTWKATLTADQLQARLQDHLGHISSVQSAQITKRDKAGIVQQVMVQQGRKKVPIDGKLIYRSINEVKSFCYTITQREDTFVIEGRGYGHHLGLCQWGAREMVRDGWDYRRILQFYYPGVSFKKLSFEKSLTAFA